MKIVTHLSFNLAYALLPFKRNQDVIKILLGKSESEYSISVVDGWHNLEFLSGNIEGREVAEYVALQFPNRFLHESESDIQKKANSVAQSLEKDVLRKYPAHVSCVGVFLFHEREQDTIVALGSVVTLLWDGEKWYKPKEIGDYSLDVQHFPSDVSHFIGRGELKSDPMYIYLTDVVQCKPNQPLLFATDGLEKVLSLDEINLISEQVSDKTPKNLIKALLKEIEARKTQRDDISILVRL